MFTGWFVFGVSILALSLLLIWHSEHRLVLLKLGLFLAAIYIFLEVIPVTRSNLPAIAFVNIYGVPLEGIFIYFSSGIVLAWILTKMDKERDITILDSFIYFSGLGFVLYFISDNTLSLMVPFLCLAVWAFWRSSNKIKILGIAAAGFVVGLVLEWIFFGTFFDNIISIAIACSLMFILSMFYRQEVAKI